MNLFERPGPAENDNEAEPGSSVDAPASHPEQEPQLDQESSRALLRADREIRQLLHETENISGDMTIALMELDDSGNKVAEHSFNLAALRQAIEGTKGVPPFKKWNLALLTQEGGEWEPYKYYGTHSLLDTRNIFAFRFDQKNSGPQMPFSIVDGDKR